MHNIIQIIRDEDVRVLYTEEEVQDKWEEYVNKPKFLVTEDDYKNNYENEKRIRENLNYKGLIKEDNIMDYMGCMRYNNHILGLTIDAIEQGDKTWEDFLTDYFLYEELTGRGKYVSVQEWDVGSDLYRYPEEVVYKEKESIRDTSYLKGTLGKKYVSLYEYIRWAEDDVNLCEDVREIMYQDALKRGYLNKVAHEGVY